jgi:carbamate kinase
MVQIQVPLQVLVAMAEVVQGEKLQQVLAEHQTLAGVAELAGVIQQTVAGPVDPA